ncbi:MAG: hypothetical protein HY204_06025 [Nitrospirae bacterium]|nr:hypothetical protein [Nitrospirota bacterium]
MTTGKKVRVKVRTVNGNYKGDLLIPPMRKRVSDVMNEDNQKFVSLTDVRIDASKEVIPFMAINKDMIESIIEELE